MGPQEKTYPIELARHEDGRFSSHVYYHKSHGKYSFSITLREQKPAKKPIRLSLTDRIPQKTRIAATAAIDESSGAAYRSRVLCSCD
jgi:hypothetical protein